MENKVTHKFMNKKIEIGNAPVQFVFWKNIHGTKKFFKVKNNCQPMEFENINKLLENANINKTVVCARNKYCADEKQVNDFLQDNMFIFKIMKDSNKPEGYRVRYFTLPDDESPIIFEEDNTFC